jgi:hypothetical protein
VTVGIKELYITMFSKREFLEIRTLKPGLNVRSILFCTVYDFLTQIHSLKFAHKVFGLCTVFCWPLTVLICLLHFFMLVFFREVTTGHLGNGLDLFCLEYI